MTLTDAPAGPPRAPLPTARAWLTSAFGAVLGLAPHVLHHIGLLAGTAFIAGTGGNALFYLLGLALSVPLLRRLHRRFDTWAAPAVAVVIFTALFALSAFVIGPALTSGTGDGSPPVPTTTPTAPTTPTATEHEGHHS